jgi:hypothetical protein
MAQSGAGHGRQGGLNARCSRLTVLGPLSLAPSTLDRQCADAAPSPLLACHLLLDSELTGGPRHDYAVRYDPSRPLQRTPHVFARRIDPNRLLVNFNLHVHVLATDGAFLPDGRIVKWPTVPGSLLAEGFRRASGK